MTDQNPNPPAPEGETPPPSETPDGTPATPAETPPAPTPEDELTPEALRAELTRARNDAARYRTSLREAQAQLADAKTPEDIAAAVAEFQARNEELERKVLVSEVARDHKLPKELEAVLAGTTKEELEAHAKVLQKFAPVEDVPVHLDGGLDPTGGGDEPIDPAALARQYGRGRRRSA